jgi:large subunit ribosomal protein L22
MPYFAAEVVAKNLACAVANAQNKYGVGPDSLVVSEVFADDGPTLKRVRPRAQGRMYKILKRSSHLTVTVSIVENKNVKAK